MLHCIDHSQFIWLVLLHAALGRNRAVVPLAVGAVVVDGVAELHGAHLPQLRLAQLAQVRRGVPVGRRRAALRAPGGAAAGGGAVADLQVDVAVLGDEGRLGPVRLDAAALRGPVLRRPDAGEGVHLPPRRERDAPRRVVPEHADRDAVDEPPASCHDDGRAGQSLVLAMVA